MQGFGVDLHFGWLVARPKADAQRPRTRIASNSHVVPIGVADAQVLEPPCNGGVEPAACISRALGVDVMFQNLEPRM